MCMKRRAFIAAAGGVAVVPAAPALATAPPDVELLPSDVTVGEDDQRLRLTVSGIEAERLVVRVDVTTLQSEANVDLSDLAVDTEATEVHAAEMTDSAVAHGDRVRVGLEFTVPEDTDAFRARVPLVGLDTSEAGHTTDLTYEVNASADGDGPVTVRRSATFDVVDPAQREPGLSFLAERVELGSTDQGLTLRAGGFPPETETGVVDLNVSAVSADANVSLSELAVDRVAVSGASLAETEVLDRGEGLLRIVFEPDDPTDTVLLDVRLTGLGTEDADPAEDVPYYALVAGDERPEEPPGLDDHDAIARFDVVDPETVDPGGPSGADTPQPDEDEPDGGGDEGADRQPGFGALATMTALAALVARRLRGDD